MNNKNNAVLPAFPDLAALSAEQIAEYIERLFVAEMVRLRTVLCMKTVYKASAQRKKADQESHNTFLQEVKAAREQMEREVNDIELEGLDIRGQLEGLLKPLECRVKSITSTAIARTSDTISTKQARERIAQLENVDSEVLAAASILMEFANNDATMPAPISRPATPATHLSPMLSTPATPLTTASRLRRRQRPAGKESLYEPESDVTPKASTARKRKKRSERGGQ